MRLQTVKWVQCVCTFKQQQLHLLATTLREREGNMALRLNITGKEIMNPLTSRKRNYKFDAAVTKKKKAKRAKEKRRRKKHPDTLTLTVF